jgi:hypothetical protein
MTNTLIYQNETHGTFTADETRVVELWNAWEYGRRAGKMQLDEIQREWAEINGRPMEDFEDVGSRWSFAIMFVDANCDHAAIRTARAVQPAPAPKRPARAS